MNVHVLPTGRRVAPFDDAVADVPIANRRLGDWLDEAIGEAGLVRVAEPLAPCLVIPDTLFTTGEVLRRFVRGAGGRNAVLVLARSVFGERTCHVQPGVEPVEAGWRFHDVTFRSGGDEPPVDVVVDPEEQVLELPLPAAFQDPDATPGVSLPRHPVLTVHHWCHLLWANQAAGASEARRMPWWRMVPRVLWAVLRTLSLDRWRILGRLNTVGRGCDIHPTAVVEGSTLGDGVRVGPYARVLFSRLGHGVTVMPGAQVEASTLGDGATVAQLAGVRLCVLYPGAFSGQGMVQASVLGRDALTTLYSGGIDLNLERRIRVSLDGRLWDSGTRFLGCAYGHRCRIGTGVYFASGRSIPNDVTVVQDPDRIVSRLPTDVAPGTWLAAGGTLRRQGG